MYIETLYMFSRIYLQFCVRFGLRCEMFILLFTCLWLKKPSAFYWLICRYWAIALPTYFMVSLVLVVACYIGLNFIATPPPTSLNVIFGKYTYCSKSLKLQMTCFLFGETWWTCLMCELPLLDEYSREPPRCLLSVKEEDLPIEPISDISISEINAAMFGDK